MISCILNIPLVCSQTLSPAMFQVEGALSAGVQVRRRHRVPCRVTPRWYPRIPGPHPTDRVQPIWCRDAQNHV